MAKSTPNLKHIEPSLHKLAVDIGSIKPDPDNVRRHSKRNLEAVKESVKFFRQQKPIVVDQDGIIRAGNATYLAMLEAGYKHIAAIRTTLSGQQAAGYAIADNRSGDIDLGSRWDLNALADQLEKLRSESDEMLASSGYTEEELNKLLLSIGRVPDLPGGNGSDDVGQEESSEPINHITMVQLFFDAGQHEKFLSACQSLSEKHGTDNLSDTVMAVILDAHVAVAQEARS